MTWGKFAKSCKSCGTKLGETVRMGNTGLCGACWKAAHPEKPRLVCLDCGAQLRGKRCTSMRCVECAKVYRRASGVAANIAAYGPPVCTGCGRGVRLSNRKRICRDCALMKANTAKRSSKTIRDPEHCPLCEGLPWRRGEDADGNRVADTCRVCGLPWEPEPMATVLEFARSGEAAA